MEIDIKDKEQFRSHLKGILTYVTETKKQEPVWNYDNFDELEELKKILERLNITDPSIVNSLKDLEKEINIAKQKKANRTEEEEAFLKDIVGINSYYAPFKINPKFEAPIKPTEIHELLDRLELLKTSNPDILIMMRLITKGYKDYLFYCKGRKEGNEFQERLFLLGIEDKKKKGFFESRRLNK